RPSGRWGRLGDGRRAGETPQGPGRRFRLSCAVRFAESDLHATATSSTGAVLIGNHNVRTSMLRGEAQSIAPLCERHRGDFPQYGLAALGPGVAQAEIARYDAYDDD